MPNQNVTTEHDFLELTLVPFILSDFWAIYSEEWKDDELIVVGALPGSENFYVAKFYEQDGPKGNWSAHSLTDQ